MRAAEKFSYALFQKKIEREARKNLREKKRRVQKITLFGRGLSALCSVEFVVLVLFMTLFMIGRPKKTGMLGFSLSTFKPSLRTYESPPRGQFEN